MTLLIEPLSSPHYRLIFFRSCIKLWDAWMESRKTYLLISLKL